MTERPVHLEREIPILVTETDIRAKRHLRSCLSCDISITAITQIDRSVLVKVCNIIAIMPIPILDDALAMGQIEDTERLTNNLIDHIVVAPMLTSTRQSPHCRHLRRRHLHTIILTAQRQKFVLLPSQVHIDIQLHVFLLDRRERHTDLQTLVAHRTDICKQLVIRKRWNRHIVGIKHISGFRVVILSSNDQAILPQAKVCTDIESRASLPFEVRIVIANHPHRHRRRTIDRHDAILPNRIHRGIRRDTSEVSRLSVTHTKFQHREQFYGRKPSLLLHIPRGRDGRKESPSMVITHHRGTIATHGEREGILVHQGIIHVPHYGSQSRVFIVAIRSTKRTRGGSTYIIIVHVIIGDSLGRSPKACLCFLLILRTDHCLESMDARCQMIVQGNITQPFLALELSPIEIALRPNPSRTELVVLIGGIRISPKSRSKEMMVSFLGIVLPIENIIRHLQVGIEVHVFRIIALIKQSPRRIHLRSTLILHPASIHFVVWISWIHGICGIKKHLRIEDVIVFI